MFSVEIPLQVSTQAGLSVSVVDRKHVPFIVNPVITNQLSFHDAGVNTKLSIADLHVEMYQR